MSISSSKVFFRFSKDCNQFVVAHSDNKASVWNSLTGNEEKAVLQKHFLNTQIEAIDIAKKKGTTLLALGNSTGKVLIYNLKTQEVTQFAQEHSGGILDLKFNEDATHIYSLSTDKKLFKYDISLKEVVYQKEIKRKNLLESGKLAVIAQENIILAQENKLTLLDPTTDTEVRKFKGHSKNVTQISVSLNYFVSYSEEGFLNVYSIKKINPIHSVNVLSQSNLLNILLINIAKNSFLMIALHHDVIETWQFSIAIVENNTQVTQTSSKSFKIPLSNVLALQSLHSQQDSENISIWAALGDNIGIEFGSIRAVINGKFDYSEFKKQILDLSSSREHKVPKVSKQVEIPDNEKGAYVLDEKDLSKAKNLNEIEVENKEEILEIVKKVDENKRPDISSVQSLSVVLVQALQNNDTQLIDFCLEKQNEEMIEQTVRGLNNVKVLLLLDKLHERLNSLPFKAPNISKWLKATLKYHSTILLTSPSAQLKLQPLSALIESRTKNLHKLIGLRGKIDMVLSLKRQQQLSQQIQGSENMSKPLVIFEEGDSSIIEENTKKVVQKTKKQQEESFSDSVSDSEEEGDSEDLKDLYENKPISEEEDDEQDSESDVEEDFKMAASQHLKERTEKYQNINFAGDDDSNQIEEEEESDFVEM